MNDNIQDVMTDSPCAVNLTESIAVAARAMRENDIGNLIVLDGERLYGILTDRDIVVRGLAADKDPGTTAVGEICSRDVATVRPTDSTSSAVRLMRGEGAPETSGRGRAWERDRDRLARRPRRGA